jgi:phage I-like protein
MNLAATFQELDGMIKTLVQARAGDILNGDDPPSQIVWMPRGEHSINAHTVDGSGYSGKVYCDFQAAAVIQKSFEEITASGRRVWLDFDHRDAEASAWVKGFSWDPNRGIIAHVEWTAAGEAALRGKAYYSFSPAFSCAPQEGRIGGLLDGHAAGGLVNAPAFRSMPALIAAKVYVNQSLARDAVSLN